MKPYDGSGFVGVDPWLTNVDEGRRLRLHPSDPREQEPEPALYFCGHCGADAFSPVTVAGIGVFCSTRCASAYQLPQPELPASAAQPKCPHCGAQLVLVKRNGLWACDPGTKRRHACLKYRDQRSA